MKGCILCILLCVFGTSIPSWADDADHETARRAVERGELLPLARILASAGKTHPGRVLDVELERDDGRYLYEIDVLLKDGRVVELTYDGRTGELLETEVDDD